MKKVFIILDETSGETNWSTHHVAEIPNNQTPLEFATELARNYYADFDEELSKDVFLFNGGCNIVKVLKAEEISDADYKVLIKYI